MRFGRSSRTLRAATRVLTLLTIFVMPLVTRAQSRPATVFGLAPGQTSAMELGFDYTYLHANAPPAQCGCFSMNGGGGNLVFNMPRGVSLVADLQATHANRINGTTQNISIFNYLFGPRYSYRSTSRFTPYGQVLAGGSEELSNYVFVQNRNAFAISAGGGASRALTSHLAWSIVEVDYIYSRLPNAVNDHQNDLRVSTGIVLRFGPLQ
jgi:outer membrane immunogenic protein